MAARKPKVWKCQRVTAGIKCGHTNLGRLQKCAKCLKPRPKRRQPAHMAVLKTTTYEECVELFGERCGICGRTRDQLPSPERRLDRDHEHKGQGRIRGLLCRECNRRLKLWMTPRWLRLATYYLEKER